MPTAMSLTRGSPQIAGMQRAHAGAGDAGGEHAEPGRAGQIGNAVAAIAPITSVPSRPRLMRPRPLGDALAEADEKKRRRDADGAAEHGERHRPQSDVAGAGHVRIPFL